MDTGDKIVVLGCGQKPIEGAINIDRINFPGVDYVCDITHLIPIEANYVDEVIAYYVLCQIGDEKDFMKVMNEVWRILKPGGLFKIKVPDARFPCAFQDPMDCRHFVKETFDYFNKDHYRFKAFNYGFSPWEIISVKKERKNRLYAILRKPQ